MEDDLDSCDGSSVLYMLEMTTPQPHTVIQHENTKTCGLVERVVQAHMEFSAESRAEQEES